MANRRVSSGLTIGQLLTLTFGFLVASVAIFLFGFWVGRDMAEQRAGRQQEVVHLPVPNTPVVTKVVAAAATETPVRVAFAPTVTSAPAKPTVSPSVGVVKATPTRLGPMVAWGITPTQRAPQKEAGGWTVQVGATTDAVQAVVLARRLRAKGYDAYTSQGPIGGVTWYRVRVGRFSDKDSAKEMEGRLRREEQIEAAYVSPQ